MKAGEREITEMLEKIPVIDAEKIEKEVKKSENLELLAIRRNLWKKWRGKTKILKRKSKITKEKKDHKKIR